MNIYPNFNNGDPKYPGLYAWQVENNVSDDDPLFPVIAMVFAVVLALPEYCDRLRQEDVKLLNAIREERRAIEAARTSERRNLYEIATIGGLVGAASFAMCVLVLYFLFFR